MDGRRYRLVPMADDRPHRPERLQTADGVDLSASWSGPEDPVAVAVLTHPHPLYGGDMHNIVPASLARTLPDHGIATVRFDFRGAGSSSGTHGGGTDETADVRAAVAAAEAAHPGVPLVGIGYSFGADVLLAVDDPRFTAVVAVAPPLAVLSIEEMRAARGAAPTLVLAAQHDQFRDAADAEAVVSDWPDTTFQVLAGADHFMAGMTGQIAERTLAFLRPLLAAR
jgi:alpha/beta superfamily hydrolase